MDLRTLVLDIETAPMLAYVWGRRDVQISTNQIKSDWYVLAWAAKWLNEPKMYYLDQRRARNIENDLEILTPLWKLLDIADIVITQNGKAFDGPKLNARFISHGMKPPSPYRHLDTYLIAKKVAAFSSNSLEYLTNKLCTKYKKLSHGKFPGMELWKECLAGNKDAWDEMKKYNTHDVLSTEELYGVLKAWAPQDAPRPYRAASPEIKCETCNVKAQMHKYGFRFTNKKKYQRWQCQSCGAFNVSGEVK